jgi:succinate-acetate transporter protein
VTPDRFTMQVRVNVRLHSSRRPSSPTPAAVGLAGFGLTTFAPGMINVGALSTSALPVIFPLALAYGGIVQPACGRSFA